MRLRASAGKREFIESTGTRVLAVAQIVGGEILARWRRHFLELEGSFGGMNVLQLSNGSPVLSLGGHLPLERAALASGIDADDLLRQASQGALELYYLLGQVRGHVLRQSDLERHDDEWNVPTLPQRQAMASATDYTGIVGVRSPLEAAASVLADELWAPIVFDRVDAPGLVFVPDHPKPLLRLGIHVETAAVERMRRKLLLAITPEQLAAAQSSAADTSGSPPPCEVR